MPLKMPLLQLRQQPGSTNALLCWWKTWNDDVNGSAGCLWFPADLFHQLLDAFEQLQHQHQAQPQQGLKSFAGSLPRLTPSEQISQLNRNAILSRQLSFQLMKLKVSRLKMPSSKTSCKLLNLVSIASINCWDTQQMRLLLLQLPPYSQSPPH